MIIDDVMQSLPQEVQIKVSMAIASPEFLMAVQKHIDFFNHQLAYLDPNGDANELKVNYRTLRQQRDNWVLLQQTIVRLLQNNPVIQRQILETVQAT